MNWNLNDIEQRLKQVNVPEGAVRMSESTVIVNPQLFLRSMLEICRAKEGKEGYRPYYLHLKEFIEKIDTHHEANDKKKTA